MSLNLEDKKVAVAEIVEHLSQAQTLVIAEYRGVTVEHMTRLRVKAREQGVFLRVLKNTLVRRAVAGTQFEALADGMVGPLIYSMSADVVAPAKVLHEFSKGCPELILKAGMTGGVVMDKAAVTVLASIPGRNELLAQLLGIMQAPVSGFARGLAALAAKKQAELA